MRGAWRSGTCQSGNGVRFRYGVGAEGFVVRESVASEDDIRCVCEHLGDHPLERRVGEGVDGVVGSRTTSHICVESQATVI